MIFNRNFLIMLLLILPGISMAASAIDEPAAVEIKPVKSHKGFYGDLNIGSGVLEEKYTDYYFVNGSLSHTQRRTEHKDKFAVNADFGYQFTRHFAVEAGYTHFNKFNGESWYGNKTVNAVDVALKAMLPFGCEDQFRLYAKLGPGYDQLNNAKRVKEKGLTAFTALGAEYNLTDQLDLNLEVLSFGPHDDLYNVSAAVIGLGYHFG